MVLLAASLLYRFTHPFHQETISTLTYQTGMTKTKPAMETSATPAIRLHKERMIHPAKPSAAIVNPLFPLPPPEKKPSREETKALMAETEPPDKIPLPVLKTRNPIDAIVDELSGLKVTGTYKSNGEFAVFFRENDAVLIAEAGKKLKNKYLVKELTQDYMVLEIPNSEQNIRINIKDFNDGRYF